MTIEGLDGLIGLLDGMKEGALDAAGEALGRGLMATAAEARALAPARTGHLRASIASRVVRKDGGIEGEARAGAQYAARVELGGPGRAPSPFLYPAYRRNRESIIEGVREAIAGALKEG